MSDDLIRRSDAIEALENIPTADKLAVIRVKSIMKKEDYESLVDSIRKQAPNVIVMPHNTELVSPTDRPQGEWIEKIVDDVKITVCSNCDKEPTFTHYYGSCGNYSLSDFCPNCGARMFAKDINVPNKKGADDDQSIL